MSHPLRSPSERYSVCCSVPDSGSFCSQDGRHLSTSSDDDPILSLPKSSTGVLPSLPHQHDPTFSRADVQRSCSTSDENCQRNHSILTKQNLDLHSPSSQTLNERWMSSMQRWSNCSRSSTPDTVIFKGSASQTLEKQPDPSKLASSSPKTPSPTMSQELTPTQQTIAQSVSSENQEDMLGQFSPIRRKNISPLPPKETLCFTFASPVSSSVSLEKFAAEDPLYAVKTAKTDPSLDQLLSDILPPNVELLFENPDFILHDFANFPSTWRRPLVTSFSDPYLGFCCRCNEHFCKNNVDFRHLEASKIREEATMTSNVELVDIGVQTFSPIGSWWNLKRCNSNVGSQSILGSPPGSRLNLRSPVGSHSNLVSPSSSMFVIHSDEEEHKIRTEGLTLNVEIDRPRSCLKIHDENRELGRRSSMKQVQWDEDGMTWDVHGAAIDPEELNMAIQKHLELKCNEEEEEREVKKPKRKSSKKKRAPKPPVNVKAPPVIVIEGRRREEQREEQRREGEQIEERGEEEEVEEEEVRKGSRSSGSVQRKRSLIRPFKTPGWCGGSRKHHD